MLPIEEFEAANTAYTRRAVIILLVILFVFFVSVCAIAVFRDAMRSFLVRRFGEAVGEALMGLSLLPTVVFAFGGLWAIEWKSWRDPRLSCPCCGKSLRSLQHVVIATRNCGYCGKRVLAEPQGID